MTHLSADSDPAPGGVVVVTLALLPALAAAAFLIFAPELTDAETALEWWWGGRQAWEAPLWQRLAIVLLPLLALFLPPTVVKSTARIGRASRDWVARQPGALVTAGLMVFLWIFRHTDLRYGDAYWYSTGLVPEEAFSTRGLFLSYDELLSSAGYSLGYRFAHLWFALDVVTWHNMVGLGCTLLFIAWLWRRSGRGDLFSSTAAVGLAAVGAWNQVAMGPVENYGQVVLLSFAFVYLSAEALPGREPVWKACLAYALGAGFHLLIAWLFPVLVWVLAMCWRRESPDGRKAAIVAMALPAFLVLSIAYFLGFDLAFFFDSHGAKVKLIPLLDPNDPYISRNIFYTGVFDPLHLAHVFCQLVLMGWPAIPAVLVGIAMRPLGDHRLPHVALGWLTLAFTFAFTMLWNTELGYMIGQDLFSVVGVGWLSLGVALLCDGAVRTRLGETRYTALIIGLLGSGMLWRIAVLFHHSILSPNYFAPWELRRY